MTRKSKRAGLTLLEVVIAGIILVIIVGFALNSLLTSTAIATKGSIMSDLESRGRIVTDFCREEFLQARFTGTIEFVAGTQTRLGIDPPKPGASPPNYSSTVIAYRIPGEKDASGALVPPLGRPVYGYGNPKATGPDSFRQDLVCVIRFEATEVLAESGAAQPASVVQLSNWGAPFPNYPTLPATRTVLNMDANHDADQADVFVRGRLRRYVLAPLGSPAYTANGNQSLISQGGMSDGVLLRVQTTGSWDGNLDDVAAAVGSRAESANDPLFRFVDDEWPLAASTLITDLNIATDGRAALITVWHGNRDERGKGFLIHPSAATIRWRNVQ